MRDFKDNKWTPRVQKRQSKESNRQRKSVDTKLNFVLAFSLKKVCVSLCAKVWSSNSFLFKKIQFTLVSVV